MLVNEASGTPALTKAIGSEIEIGRCWIDIIYPSGPTPQYERAG
jgi:hypothetical protein